MNAMEQTLDRSHQFAEYLRECIGSAEEFAGGARAEAAVAASDLSLEHGFALKLLFGAGAPSSAVALLRLQYEALLRAGWLQYAATELQVEKASAPLTKECAAAAKNLPNAKEMLGALERRMATEPGLRGLVVPLRELREMNWTAMNAFVHAGLLPLAMTAEGFPEQLAVDLIKMSNALVHMAARLLARFTGDEGLLVKVETSFKQFEDVLPMMTLPS